MVICKVCKSEDQELNLQLNKQLEKVVIDMIRHDHPEWVETDGACQKCIEYYKQLDHVLPASD